MMLQHVTRKIAGIALGAGMALGAATSAALADDAAESFVAQILSEAEPILSAPTEAELFDGIGALVDKYVDMRRVGRFTLGQYARQMTDEQAADYYPLFKTYATQIYQQSLANYSGEKLEVSGSVDRSERDIIVNSDIVTAAAGSAAADMIVHWRVYRDSDGNMTVVDAGANNVWLAIEQRSQFTSVIANNGGGAQGIDALIADIREQVGE